ncbi:endolytic transglycosylase MltG [Lentiprolixibacter aurantiacus]|uniref:Endolytic murein transglycosylase n=1 Tax=Lentiprolixibacter aurantiacus TaxID=2993939 RepID=A0AAE3ML01_9FLAO|nr:endolytic transglycosylase MltG [Lentiprolixibacter aurantiacus]MCX2719358.1 endolytic transglycosylase MltG [Lentiprolixibacter aurantiacus]
MYIKRLLLIIAFLGLIGGGIFAYMVYDTFFLPNTRFKNEEAFVYISSDADFSQVRETLEPLLEDVDAFEAVAKRKQYIGNIRAGKYRIGKGMNNNEIVNALRIGNIPVKVSFNNQETLPLLAGRIASQIEADSLSLLQAMQDKVFLEEKGIDPEAALGMYLPNSYEFYWNTGAEEFRDRMFKEYDKFWNDQRKKKAGEVGLSPMQIVALASIVHKETSKVEERPRVAGVYLNRLRRNMLLQADPTVIYAIKKESGNYDTVIKRVLYRDLALDSPYNTYKYPGVPPGPIAMPDISAIEAVLNAEKHRYLYFVADVESFGYHKFAETLSQHNRNKVQYVRWINGQNVNR